MADAEQPFSVMKIDFVPHSDWIRRGAQYMHGGSKTCRDDCIFGWEAMMADHAVGGR